jgi:hypothetical protein
VFRQPYLGRHAPSSPDRPRLGHLGPPGALKNRADFSRGERAACEFLKTMKSSVSSRLLLIRLFQETPTRSVMACRARRSRKLCANSSRSLPRRRLARSTWPSAAGPMASSLRVRCAVCDGSQHHS